MSKMVLDNRKGMLHHVAAAYVEMFLRHIKLRSTFLANSSH